MNKWFYRAVGTVGVASGFLLLAGGAAQADDADAARPAIDPQQLRGLLDDFFTPTAGLVGASTAPTAGLPATATPVGNGPVARGPVARGPVAHGPAGDVNTAGNDVFLTGLLPNLGDGLAPDRLAPTGGLSLDRLAPVGGLGAVPTAPQAPGTGVHPAATESGGPEFLPLPDLPLVGDLLNSRTLTPLAAAPIASTPIASTPVTSTPRAGEPGAGMTSNLPGAADLPAALPVTGVDPVRGFGLLDALLPAVTGHNGGTNHGATRPVAPGGDQLGTDRLGTDRLGTDRLGTDQLAADQLAADQLAADQLAADQLAADQLGTDQLAADQLSADRLGADQLGADQLGAGGLGGGQVGNVDGDQLGHDQVLGMLPSGLRPTVSTGSVGTWLPGVGPVGLDSQRDTAGTPAVIGDAMTARRPDLFAPAGTSIAPTRTGITPVGTSFAPAGMGREALAPEALPLLGTLPLLGALAGGGQAGALPALPVLGGGPARALPIADAPATTLPGGPAAVPITGPASGPATAPATAPATRPVTASATRPVTGTATAPARRIVSSPTGRHAERPVAGEDADYR